MLTTINEFKLKRLRTKQYKADLFVVNVINVEDEDYLKRLNHFCNLFPRVYQLTNKGINYIFNKQTSDFNISYRELKVEMIPALFYEHEIASVKLKFKNIPDDNTIFITKTNEAYIYLGKKKWIFLSKELLSYFQIMKKSEREVILTGDSELVTIWINIFRLFDIPTTIDYVFVLFK